MVFSKTLVKFNVPVDNSIVNFAKKIYETAYVDYKSLKETDVYVQVMQSCVFFKVLYENFDAKCKNDEMNIKLFEWSDFDFKYIVIHAAKENYPVIFDELSKIKSIFAEFVAEAFEPPMDIEKMVYVVSEAFNQLELKLARCQDAFVILRSSLDILKNNYKEYYKECISTGNNLSFLDAYKRAITNNPALQNRRKKSATLQAQFNNILRLLNDTYLQHMHNVDPKTKEIINVLLQKAK